MPPTESTRYQIGFARPLKRAVLDQSRSRPAKSSPASAVEPVPTDATQSSAGSSTSQSVGSPSAKAAQLAATQALESIANQLQQHDAQWLALRQQMQQLAVAAATEMARGIVGYEIQHHLGRLEHLLNQALQESSPQSGIQMFVSREDHEQFANHLKHHPAAARRIQLTVDDKLNRGDCIFVSDRESVIAEWNRQLEDLHARVMECLTDAWAE